MELSQTGGWCAPSVEMATTRSFFADLAAMSDEELAAYAETQRGGGPCGRCGGTGYEHQPCSCPYCEGVKDDPCIYCDGSGVELDSSSLYTRESVERLAQAGADLIDLPEITVRRRGGIQYCACIGDPNCFCGGSDV